MGNGLEEAGKSDVIKLIVIGKMTFQVLEVMWWSTLTLCCIRTYFIFVYRVTGVQVKLYCKPCGRLKGRNPLNQNGNVFLWCNIDEDL